MQRDILWPAEFGPHRAVWLAWPGNASDWPGKFAPIAWVYGEMVRKFADAGERVRLLVRDARQAAAARRRVLAAVGADLSGVEWFTAPMDRGWTRDFMPFFVRRGQRVAAVDFGFTGWAKYPDHALDDAVGPAVCRGLGMEVVTPLRQGRRVVLEGGAMDGNGRGDVLTTEECLLDPAVQVRNPGFGKGRLRVGVPGASRHAQRHLARPGHRRRRHPWPCGRPVPVRFAGHGGAVPPRTTRPTPITGPWPRTANVWPARDWPTGGRLAVIDLPMPRPLSFKGQRLPASYANFFIGEQGGPGSHLQRRARPAGPWHPGRSLSRPGGRGAVRRGSGLGGLARSTA